MSLQITRVSRVGSSEYEALLVDGHGDITKVRCTVRYEDVPHVELDPDVVMNGRVYARPFVSAILEIHKACSDQTQRDEQGHRTRMVYVSAVGENKYEVGFVEEAERKFKSVCTVDDSGTVYVLDAGSEAPPREERVGVPIRGAVAAMHRLSHTQAGEHHA